MKKQEIREEPEKVYYYSVVESASIVHNNGDIQTVKRTTDFKGGNILEMRTEAISHFCMKLNYYEDGDLVFPEPFGERVNAANKNDITYKINLYLVRAKNDGYIEYRYEINQDGNGADVSDLLSESIKLLESTE